MAGALTLTEFGTTYYDNVMSVFVLSGLAILVLNRDALREGPLRKAAACRRLPAFITGMAMGLKLPEMPFCVGFAARAAGAGRKLEASGGAADRPAASPALPGFALFSAWPWMLHM